jgi:hypothetical protein
MNTNNQEKFEVRDLRIKEKFFIDDLYLNGYAKKCGIYATGVYLSLCRHANKDQQCWPAEKTIAEELNISPKQVGRVIKILEKFNIIRKKRVGKKLNNRYSLLDKSEWTDSPFAKDHQSDYRKTDSPFHSKETHLMKQNNKEKVEAYKKGKKWGEKPYYHDEEMRWCGNIWKVIPKDGGQWLEFAELEEKIEWKPIHYNRKYANKNTIQES